MGHAARVADRFPAAIASAPTIASKSQKVQGIQGFPASSVIPGCYYHERMYPELEAAVDDLEIPQDRDGIVAAIAVRDRLDGKITAAVGEFQALGLHEVDGSVTMATWLRHRAKLDGTAASWRPAGPPSSTASRCCAPP